MPEFYRQVARPLLFIVPAEMAQKLAKYTLRAEPLWKAIAAASKSGDPRLRTQWCGIELPNPVGLAAGLDKDCQHLPSLAAWGFGYMVAGTVTIDARPGNDKPRLFADQTEESLTNAFGFPSRGLQAAAQGAR